MSRASRRVVRRNQQLARDQRQLYRLKSIDVPMAPNTRVQDPLPYMQVPVAADPSTGTIYSDGAMDRYTAAHESAHLLEKYMTDADKKRFAKVMGMAGRPWEVGHSGAVAQESDGYRGSVGELFADYVAMLATRHDPEGNQVIAAYADNPPSRKRLIRLGRSLERFGKRHGLPEYQRPRRG